VARLGSTRLWNSDTGKRVRMLATPTESAVGASYWEGVNGLTFSPNGKTLAVGRREGIIQLFDMSTGKERLRWQAHNLLMGHLTYSPDGKTLASCASTESAIRLWDPSTGKEIVPDPGHVGPVEHLRFRSDGQHLFSTGYDGRLLDWDLATKTCRPLFAGDRPTGVDLVALSPDGKLLARCAALDSIHNLHVYDTATGKEIHTLKGDKNYMRALAFDAQSNRLASVDGDFREREGIARLWRLDTGALVWQTPMDVSNNSRSTIYPFVFSPDGKWLAFSTPDGKGIVRLYDAATGKEVRRYTSTGEVLIFALAWSPDSTHLAITGNEGTPAVVLWNVRTGAVSRSWPHPEGRVYRIASSPDGRVLAMTEGYPEQTIGLWEVATGRAIATFKGHPAYPVRFSPEGRTLASGSDTSILLGDVTGRSPGGKLRHATVSAERFAQLWEKLAGNDAPAAHAALWELVAGGRQVLPHLKDR
jgi:WD40 repeat protein